MAEPAGGGGAIVVSRLGTQLFLTGATPVAAGLRNFQQSGDEAAGSMLRLRTSLLYLSFGLLAAGGMLAQVGRRLDDLKDKMTSTFAEIDYRATQVSTVLEGTGQVSDNVRDKMMDLGRQTEYTAQQAGDAMMRLAMAGFSTEEAMGAAGPTLMLATIGMIDVERAADIATGTLNSFGMIAEHAGNAANALQESVAMLAHAATDSMTNVEELGQALKFVGSVAELLGVEMSEAIGFLMIAADNMHRAGIAGRALRMSLLRTAQAIGLQTTGVRMAREVIAKYNIELADADGNMKGLADQVDELNDKLSELTDTQMTAALAQLEGTRAAAQWTAVINEGRRAIEAERLEVEKSGDVYDVMTAKYRTAGDYLREQQMELEAAASKEALYRAGIKDINEQLEQWRKEIDETGAVSADFSDTMGLTIEQQAQITELLIMSADNTKLWTDAVRSASIASVQWEDRLQTLYGTQMILKSSVETLYASLAEHLAPMMMKINELFRDLSDMLSALPKPVLKILGFIVVFGAIFATLASKILMTFGSLMMFAAAMMYTNKQVTAGRRELNRLTFAEAINQRQTDSSTASMGLFAIGLRVVRNSLVRTTAAMWLWIKAHAVFMVKTAGLIALLYFMVRAWKEGQTAVLAFATAIMVLYTRYVWLNTLQGQILIQKMKMLALSIREKFASWASAAAKRAETISLANQTAAYWENYAARQGLMSVTWRQTSGEAIGVHMINMKTGALVRSIPVTTAATAANYSLAASIWAVAWPLLLVMAVVMGAFYLLKKFKKGTSEASEGMEDMSDSSLRTRRTIQDQNEYYKSMYARSDVPDYFAAGAKHIRESMQRISGDVTAMPGMAGPDLGDRFRRARVAPGRALKAEVNVDMSRMQVGSIRDAEVIQSAIREAIAKSTEQLKWEISRELEAT